MNHKHKTLRELEKQIAGYQLENGDEAIYLIIRRGGQEIAMIGIGAIMPYLEALIHSSNKVFAEKIIGADEEEFYDYKDGSDVEIEGAKTRNKLRQEQRLRLNNYKEGS